MTDLNEIGQVVYLLGKLEGQVRELVHSVNNTAQIVTGLTDKVNSTIGLPEKVADHERRITILEAQENKRVGAIGLGAWIVKAAPVLMALAAGAGIMGIMK